MSGHSETRRPRFDPDGAVAAANRIERPPKHARPRAMNGLRRRARTERRPLKAREPPRGRPRDATMMRSDDRGAVPPAPIRGSVKRSTYPYNAKTGSLTIARVEATFAAAPMPNIAKNTATR